MTLTWGFSSLCMAGDCAHPPTSPPAGTDRRPVSSVAPREGESIEGTSTTAEGAARGLTLADLPREILVRLPNELESLQDLGSFSLTSRLFHATSSHPSPELLYRLATSPHTGLQPYPHLLLAVKARALADWAVQNDANRTELGETVKNGCEPLLQLALRISPLSVDDLRRLQTARRDVLIPLSEILEPMYGPASRILLGLADELTICENVILALTNMWIYSELFHHSISASYRTAGTVNVTPLSDATRMDYMRYCIPDVNCIGWDAAQSKFEQLDIHKILEPTLDMVSEALTSRRFCKLAPAERWFVKSAFHTGIAGLALAIPGRAVPEEIEEVRRLIQGKVDEGVDVTQMGDFPEPPGADGDLEEKMWFSLHLDNYRALDWF